MTINERVISLLNSKGLKQKELSDAINVSTSTLNNWLKLGRDIPSKYIAAISEYLNVSTDFLLTGKEDTHLFSMTCNLSESALNLAKRFDALDSDGQTIVSAELIKAERWMKEEAENKIKKIAR